MAAVKTVSLQARSIHWASVSLSTLEVAEIARITPRRLQLMDEASVVKTKREGRCRVWSPMDAVAVCLYSSLLNRGVKISTARGVCRKITDRVSFGELLTEETLMMWSPIEPVWVSTDVHAMMGRLVMSPCPVVVESLTGHARRVEQWIARSR